MSPPCVAVVDIGSNSIKALVASRATDGSLQVIETKTLDARISAGISHAHPRLGEAGMQRGVDAIRELLAFAAPHAPQRTVLVATSAVRDAENGDDFRARVRDATGAEIRILTGDEEANLIGRGLTSDPALAGMRDFHVFDLGGGSLECLAFRDRRIRQAVSLQLGCVRLTEQLVANPAAPLSSAQADAISRHVRDALTRAAVMLPVPADATVVGAGGTLTTARAIFAARSGRTFETADTRLTVAALRELLVETGRQPLDARCRIEGLASARADVFPTALATLLGVAEAGQFDTFHHSVCNLRWGLAAETLDALAG